MKKIKIVLGVLIAGFLLSQSVYFDTLSERRELQVEQEFDPMTYVSNFWQQLPDKFAGAVDASTLLDLFQSNMKQAVNQYGRTLGVSSSHSYLLKGEGTVTNIQNDVILINLSSEKKTIAIQTDFIFGNDVRDASDLVNVNDFPNTMEFNTISSEINKMVATHVLAPILEIISTGDHLGFVAAATVNEETPEINPLKVVPVSMEILN